MSRNLDYQAARALASQLDCPNFTALQQEVYSRPEIYSDDWLFVVGNTSSGKTLIPMLRYFMDRLDGKPVKLLFAVPYRALAAQKYREFQEMSSRLGLDLHIEQSTGEFRGADQIILAGQVDIGVIIYEKIFLFSSMDGEFLSRYQVLVMDEIGLTQDPERGMKADFILCKARAVQNLRVIALATPYYDWSRYLESFRFRCVRQDERPVELKQYPIYCSRQYKSKIREINHLEADCAALQTGALVLTKRRQGEDGPWQWTDEIVEDICEYHLRLGHTILIFINNREEVRSLARRLCTGLQMRHALTPWASEQECRDFICAETHLVEEQVENQLYGVFDQVDFQCFAYGVSYHSAALPASLRTAIENQILGGTGHLRIVCCTETLAYGINSNVDVVIIPDMNKQRPGESPPSSFLRANEYMNYAGRAGRLSGDRQVSCGYVYAILRACYVSPGGQREPQAQQLAWESLQQEIREARCVGSHYYTMAPEVRPFYLLSLFSNRADGSAVIDRGELEKQIRCLPAPEGWRFDPEEMLDQPLAYLAEKRFLSVRVSSGEFDDEEDGETITYSLTEAGVRLTGYIIRQDDYDNLLRSLAQCGDGQLYIGDLLYDILSSQDISREILLFFGAIGKLGSEAMQRIGKNAVQFLLGCQNMISPRLKEILSRDYGISWGENPESAVSLRWENWSKLNQLCLMAALMFWREPSCSIKKLYDRFHLHFAQMQRLAQQISYYLDIAALSVRAVRLEEGRTLLAQLGPEGVDKLADQIWELSKTLYFQVSPQVCRFLDVEVNDPDLATQVQAMSQCYMRLKLLERKQIRGRPFSEQDRQQIHAIQSRLSQAKPAWQEAFQRQYGRVLNNAD